VASADDHRLEDAEIALKNPDFETTFPPHCLRGTPGRERIPQTCLHNPLEIDSRPRPPGELAERIASHDGEILIKKQWFDVFTNPNTETVVPVLDPGHVVVYGVALDVCDRFAIEGLLARGRRVHLVRDAARAIRPEEGERLISEWQKRGVGMATTEGIVAGDYLARLEP
jgi:nicotinamidase-related amidase